MLFPTPVGVFLGHYSRFGYTDSLPHARGGVSAKTLAVFAPDASSPRPWGWFHLAMLERNDVGLFPTPVGVFLVSIELEGVPWVSSPRPWGCFRFRIRHPVLRYVFPTPVGVFLVFRSLFFMVRSLPHARGGGSYSLMPFDVRFKSSPRPWGWFSLRGQSHRRSRVFPTPVGVFPVKSSCSGASSRLPHARGGVSRLRRSGKTSGASSPRPWGWFFHDFFSLLPASVFPTPVGVVLISDAVHPMRVRLPHARGGVSTFCVLRLRIDASSPRPWGWFPVTALTG